MLSVNARFGRSARFDRVIAEIFQKKQKKKLAKKIGDYLTSLNLSKVQLTYVSESIEIKLMQVLI